MRLRKGFIYLGWFAFFLLIQASAGLAQTPPDPLDSLIIESKTVAPGFDAGFDTSAYLYIRVWITNKDTLFQVSIPMQVRSVSGGAYAILGWPRSSNGAGTINRLTNTLSNLFTRQDRNHSDSPDTLGIQATPLDFSNTEPPNPTRKALWEIKFDTVLANLGTFELDTTGHILGIHALFTNAQGFSVTYNFINSTITVCGKGDLNCDGDQRPEDVILMLYCVFLGIGNCALGFTDVDCDGGAGSTDVVLLLNEIFLDIPFPC